MTLDAVVVGAGITAGHIRRLSSSTPGWSAETFPAVRARDVSLASPMGIAGVIIVYPRLRMTNLWDDSPHFIA